MAISLKQQTNKKILEPGSFCHMYKSDKILRLYYKIVKTVQYQHKFTDGKSKDIFCFPCVVVSPEVHTRVIVYLESLTRVNLYKTWATNGRGAHYICARSCTL